MTKCGADDATTVNGNKHKYGKVVSVLKHHTFRGKLGVEGTVPCIFNFAIRQKSEVNLMQCLPS